MEYEIIVTGASVGCMADIPLNSIPMGTKIHMIRITIMEGKFIDKYRPLRCQGELTNLPSPHHESCTSMETDIYHDFMVEGFQYMNIKMAPNAKLKFTLFAKQD